MNHQIDADKILDAINNWRTNLIRVWEQEKQMEGYANGGPPPNDDPTCEDEIVPLGFAIKFMGDNMAPLLDPLHLEPGMIDGKLINPAINVAERTQKVQMCVNEELNKIVMARMKATLTNAAGRATVTGRACVFRKSRNDWVFKCGRLIHPPEAGVDLLDSSFREWAFAEEMSLRDVEARLKSSSSGKYGWSKAGLETLKLWIMAAEAEKYSKGNLAGAPAWTRTYDPGDWLTTSISDAAFAKPVDVFWYFHKNGKITKDHPRYGGHEKIDLYCISRFGSQSAIRSEMKGQTNFRWMETSKDNPGKKWLKELESKRTTEYDKDGEREDCTPENERLLFCLPDAFDSIEEALIFALDDTTISGDQRMSDVTGSGKSAMPKLAVMEGLLADVIGGMSFGAQNHWTVAAGTGQEYLNQLQRGGLRANQAFPVTVKPMEKNNIFSGYGQVKDLIRMMDTGIAADSTANSQGNFGGSQAEFAAQAQAGLTNQMAVVNRRMDNWLSFLSKVCEQVARTICRPWSEMRKEYPCYQDAQRLRIVLKARYDIHEDEWDADRWEYPARRLAGAMMRQQAVSMNQMLIQVVGPIMPSLMPQFAKEILRATFGDTIAAQMTAATEQPDQTQTDRARNNVTVAYVTGQSPDPQPMDDPIEHSKVAGEVLEGRIRAAMATGTKTQAEMVGCMAVAQYAVKNIARVPEQIGKPALDKLQAMLKALEQVPTQQPQQEGAMTEKERAEIEIKKANQERLNRQLDVQKNDKEIKQLESMRKLSNAEQAQSEQQKTLAVQRAASYQGMELALQDANLETAEFLAPTA